MMRVLIIGASKGIGLETTRQALESGHHVRALARSATGMALSDPNLEKVRGDALKAEDVEAALIGVDVVIQTLGVGLGDLFRPVHLFSDATRVLIAAMRAQGVKRLIFERQALQAAYTRAAIAGSKASHTESSTSSKSDRRRPLLECKRDRPHSQSYEPN